MAGKRAGGVRTQQLRINNRLIQLARQGLRVVRLKGGDPLVFGRGGEEAVALATAGIAFRIVPGISAGHWRHRGGRHSADAPQLARSVAFATGHDSSGDLADVDWQAAVPWIGGAGVLYGAAPDRRDRRASDLPPGEPPPTRSP